MSYAYTVFKDAPTAYWRLNDAIPAYTGVSDSVGNFTGIRSGGTLPVILQPSLIRQVGASYFFVGSTGSATASQGALPAGGNAQFSIEAWVNLSLVDASFRRICGVEPASNHGAFLYYVSGPGFGVLRGDVAAGNDGATSGVTPVVGSVYHVVGTYDGVNLRIYVNGNLVGTQPSSRSVDLGAALFWIGGGTAASPNTQGFFAQEVATYSFALSAAQVLAHFQSSGQAVNFGGQLGVVGTPGVGVGASMAGSVQFGGFGPLGGSGLFATPLALPSLPRTSTLPFIAHLYTNTLKFKKSLGPLLNRPKLTWTLNAGHHPAQLELPVNDTTAIGPSQGDIVRLTEQGGDGRVVYTGILDDIQLSRDERGPYISLQLDPLVTELGEAYFDHNYSKPVDIAQMVRDAVTASSHCTFTPQSIPDTGIYAIFNFRLTTVIEVINTCKHIGGPYFWFYVDEYGVVWFQQINLTNRPNYTLTGDVPFTVRKKVAPLSTLKNIVVVAGGVADQVADGNAIFAVYSDPVSIAKYGARFFYPIFFYPAAVDQATVSAIAINIGTVMNRLRSKVTVTLPAYGSRILLGRFGGPSIRYIEPATEPLTETLTGSDFNTTQGQYSANYCILEVAMDGPNQVLTLGDLPVTSDDFKYAIDGTVARMTHHLLLYPPLSSQHYFLIGQGSVGSV